MPRSAVHKPITQREVEAWGATIDARYLEPALTHRSWAYENGGEHSERLEFLGDSILGAVVTSYIFEKYPEMDEGFMSKIKAAAVSERSLAQIARRLGLGAFIRLGHGEEMSGGRDKDSILADTMEALIGATFLTHGVKQTNDVVLRHLIAQVAAAEKMGPALDWRTAFEEKARDRGIVGDLSYVITGEGPDHARVYTATVLVDGVAYGQGTASSQKQAKLEACRDAYDALG